MRPYVNGYTAPPGGFTYTATEWRNRKLDGYGNLLESGTVPGAANEYTVELDERIVKNGTLTVNCGGDNLTIVPYGVAPGIDQAAVYYDLPLVQINSAREGQALNVTYEGGGGVLSAERYHELQRAVVALQAAKSDVGHTHAIADITSLQTALDGKQPLATILTAIAALASTGIVARTGTGTVAVRTMTGTGTNITVTNGNGVSGNPTINVGSNISKLDSENLFTTAGRQVYTRNGNSDYAGSTAINNSYFFTLGRGEYGAGTYRLIGFGYTNTTVDCPPAFIGYREVSGGGQTNGEIVFGTRLATTNTDATVRARIKNDGDLELYHGLQVGSGTVITKILSATASLNFPSIAAGAVSTLTITVSGAASGDSVQVTPPSTIEAGLMWCGFVSAADTVTVRLRNATASAIDPAAATWRATVTKF